MAEEQAQERKTRKREAGVLAIGRIQKELDELESPEAQMRVLEYCMSEVRERRVFAFGNPAGTRNALPPPAKQPELPFEERPRANANGFGLE